LGLLQRGVRVHADGGAPEPPYHKNYLVPIVERVPFVNPRWFDKLQWFGGAAPGERGPVYRLPLGSFGILICYESVFEDLSRRYRRLGADFLVNVTNDAWYGRTSASYQHPAHLVMRAIETRVAPRVRPTTVSDSLTCWAGAPRTPKCRRPEGEVYTSDARTLYVLLGDWVGWHPWLARSLVGAAGWRKP
jgi:apolipoprotein N-acyltransferase